MALGKIAFVSPRIVCPSVTLNSSVAKLSSAAKGTMARKFVTNTTAG